jgi:hypothetical protein
MTEHPGHPYGAAHGEGHKPADEHYVADREISTRGVVVFTAWMGAITVAALVLMWLLLKGFLRAEAGKDPTPPPLAAEMRARAEQGPPSPTLQREPVADMREMRRSASERLTSYGWVEEGQVAHIPIDRAIELVAKAGHLRAGQ